MRYAPEPPLVLPVGHQTDSLFCQRSARSFGLACGLAPDDALALATAASELAANIVAHAQEGSLTLRRTEDPPGVELVAADRGPGIGDVELAVQDGFSRGRWNAQGLLAGEGPSKSLGCGLGAVRRLMDELHIESEAGKGTTVTARKWLR